MKRPGKRKSKYYKKIKVIEDEEKDQEEKEEEKEKIKQSFLYPKKKIHKNNKNNKNKKNSISEISKESYNYIYQIMNFKGETNKKYKEDEEDKKTEDKDNNDNNNNKEEEDNKNKLDKIFLSSLYDLFEEYDEIIIQKDKEKQYKISACIKIDEDKEIKFVIIYDQERDYFDYYSTNKNFEFKDEDEPFNYDLDIPKTDFCRLIRNFKKFKNK